MKLMAKTAIAAMAFVVGFSSASHAQSNLVRVHIPFAFQAGAHVLPAGAYDIRTGATFAPIVITPVSGAAQTYLPVKVNYKATNAQGARLVFRAYASSYFLHRIQNAAAEGVELFASPAEQEVAKANAPREVALLLVPHN